jgi:hypothetical protein
MADLIRLLLAGGVPIRAEGCMLRGDEAMRRKAAALQLCPIWRLPVVSPSWGRCRSGAS